VKFHKHGKKKRRSPKSWKRELLRTGTLFLVTALSLGLFFKWAASRGALDVHEVRIVGTQYCDPVEILRVASPEIGTNLFADHSGAVLSLQRMPLIKSIDIDRIPPDRLVIRVSERKPVALLSGETVIPLDEEGWLLPISISDFQLDLPIIRPAGNYSVDAVDRIDSGTIRAALRFLTILRNSGLPLEKDISVLTVEEDGEIRFTTVSRDFKIYMGQDNTIENLHLLMEVMKDLGGREIESCAIDMRYEDQVVVY
jgi:cell division septal protein FtsQ